MEWLRLALWENDLSVKPETSLTTNILGWRGFAWAARLNDAIKMLINRPRIIDGSLFFNARPLYWITRGFNDPLYRKRFLALSPRDASLYRRHVMLGSWPRRTTGFCSRFSLALEFLQRPMLRRDKQPLHKQKRERIREERAAGTDNSSRVKAIPWIHCESVEKASMWARM